jgi:hypothetical protein
MVVEILMRLGSEMFFVASTPGQEESLVGLDRGSRFCEQVSRFC